MDTTLLATTAVRQGPPPYQKPLSTADLEGTWVRTDRPDQGIVRVVVEAPDGQLRLRVESAGSPCPGEWGAVPAEAVYAASPEAASAVAFTATYNLPAVHVQLHANLSKGLLIIGSMARFSDRSCGEFARAFFRKL